MPKNRRKNVFFYFMVFVSFFSLIIIVILAFYPTKIQEDFQWRKPLVGSIFTLLCILGISAVFAPQNCSKIFHENKIETSNDHLSNEVLQKSSNFFGIVLTHGHHPTCQNFLHHEFRIGEKTFCVACMGLFSGALASIFGASAIFFLDFLDGKNSLPIAILGVLSVALGLLHYTFFDVHQRLIRFLINALFIFGMFLILAGVDGTVQNLTVDLFLVSLFVFWLYTRILLSKNKHREICQNCNLDCHLIKEGKLRPAA